MVKIPLRALLLLVVALPSGFLSFAQNGPARTIEPEIQTTQDGLLVEWRVDPPLVERTADGLTRISIPGYDQEAQPGAPLLPIDSLLVAVPPGAQALLEVQTLKEETLALQAPVAWMGLPQGVLHSPDGQVIGGAFAATPAPSTQEQPPLEIETAGISRGVHLARIIFHPVRVVGGDLQITRQVQARVRFEGLPGGTDFRQLAAQAANADPLLATLRDRVANPGDLLPEYDRGLVPPPRTLSGQSAQMEVAVEVEAEGLTLLTYAALLEAGFPVGQVDPRNLHLQRDGQEVAYEWLGDEDAKFENTEAMRFYAAPRFSRWSRSDVYWLSIEETPGLRMTSRPATSEGLPAGVPIHQAVFEQNQIYTPDCYCAPLPAGRDGDRWVWDRLQLPDRNFRSYPFELDGIESTQPATATLWMISYTDVPVNPDHQLDVILNGELLGERMWDGKTALRFDLPVEPGLLEANNELSLSLPEMEAVATEGVWLDAFAIRYPVRSLSAKHPVGLQGLSTPHAYRLGIDKLDGWLVYDVSDPDRAVRLTAAVQESENALVLADVEGEGERQYWFSPAEMVQTPSRLRVVTQLQTGQVTGADYLVIAPASLQAALKALLDLRQEQGLQVALEDVQAIYDQFGDGRMDPEAIHAYLEWAYATWKPRPAYLLLAGDGTADPKGYAQASPETLIPPYLADVDPWAGETASDNRYVTLQGEDNLPDMLVGRLPVNSPEEARAVVDKIVRWERSAAGSQWWERTHLFVADDLDGGGDFSNLSERVAAEYIQPPLDVRRLYYRPDQISADAFRRLLLEDWERGGRLFTYTGHASIHQWAAERFLHLDDVPRLTNQQHLPVVLEMTCFTSAFQVPGFSTLDEALLRSTVGGAVAVWGPTGLGVATGHSDLEEGFYARLAEGKTTLGSAILSGKLQLANDHPAFGDLIDTFTLLGDPATPLSLEVGPGWLYLPFLNNGNSG